MHPKHLSIADFRYDLPQERIADHPLPERDDSKLLIYRDGIIGEDRYRNIAGHLPDNTLLIFNNTRVVEARIVFQKPSGARIEIFCLEPPPEYSDPGTAMRQTGGVRWKCLIGGASKWKAGQVLRLEADGLVLEARWLEKLEGCFLVGLSWSPENLSFAELLHRAGLMPLPPYIHRAAEQSDNERYQTVYARHDGSVAAPTAGLHFTATILQTLEEKNIRTDYTTLHVGAGTFMPVKGETLGEHVMHSEFITIGQDTLKKILDASGGCIIPVGTTSLRTIESLYWLGIKVIRNPAVLPEDLVVHQWDPYEGEQHDEPAGGGEENQAERTRPDEGIGMEEALRALLHWMERRELMQFFTKTQILITPGYSWKVAGGLITNFHQPSSTLLLLVAALIGEDWKKVYQYALDHSFRFLSYGDGSLLFRKT